MFASGSITGLSQAAQVTPPKDSAPDGNTIGAQQHLYLSSVSCATTGECAATGDYFTSTNADAGMFVEGAGGTLGSQGYRLPVLGHPRSVSCAAGGACAAAVGSSGLLGQTTPYDPSHPATTGWQLESPSAPSPYGASVFNAADCFAAGACAAVGQTDTSNSPMFGWDESGGAWQSPGKYMPPPANGDAGSASPTVVGCASAGNCSAFGGYNVAGNPYGFVANEVDGTWKQATTLPPPAGGYSDTSGITSISCADVGDCTAVGSYTTTGSSGIGEGFVVDGRTTSSGTTSTGGTTTQPPGGGSAGTAHAGAPHASGTTVSISISCSGAGACTVKLKLTATETLKGSKVIALTARAKKHKKVVVLGRAIATIPGGHTAIAKVSLNSLGKRLLKQRKALPLTLTITQRTTRIATDHLRLKRR
jgi:hypothetical protein